jgi:hypothetical protein
VGQSTQDGLRPHRWRARAKRDGARRPAHLHHAGRRSESGQDRRSHRGQKAFAAAHWGRVRGRARGTDLLSGRVRCGLCQRLMALDQNGEGRKLYRCHHRGQGCSQPRRTNIVLHRAAVLGLRFIGDDVELQAAIRLELDRAPLCIEVLWAFFFSCSVIFRA